MSKYLVLLIVVLVLVGAFFAYTLLNPSGGISPKLLPPEKGELVLGTVLPLTGKYSVEGLNSLNGIQTMIKWVNERKGGLNIGGKLYKLRLVYFDSKSSPEETTKLYKRLGKEYKVNFFIGPYTSKLTVAALKAVKDNIIMIHGGASDNIMRLGHRYAVQVLSPASSYMKGVVDMIAERDPNAKIALIYEEGPFAISVVDGIKSSVNYQNSRGKNLEIVFEGTYRSPDDIPSLVQKGMSSGATVLIGGGHLNDGIKLVKATWDSGWELKAVGILVAPVFPEFYERLGEIAENVIAPTQWEPTAKYDPILATKIGVEWYGPSIDEFLQMYRNLTRGEEPTYQAAEAAASVLYLVRAIEKANSIDQNAVRQAFNKLDVLTFFGRLRIAPSTGLQVGHEMLIIQWQNGRKVVIYPEGAAEKQPIYPADRWWNR